ncbi:hypothetical protein EVAR_48427_1 [Eumeta japonica]|uniref:Uncharacterized protein n=1 Tax=Eumeta variegata TaxID=151549 RepID=A0A4C1XT62_EUMVA|nr:hypothetical protein EVAR_48427_1 [Eumeta japonica]
MRARMSQVQNSGARIDEFPSSCLGRHDKIRRIGAPTPSAGFRDIIRRNRLSAERTDHPRVLNFGFGLNFDSNPDPVLDSALRPAFDSIFLPITVPISTKLGRNSHIGRLRRVLNPLTSGGRAPALIIVSFISYGNSHLILNLYGIGGGARAGGAPIANGGGPAPRPLYGPRRGGLITRLLCFKTLRRGGANAFIAAE